MLRWQEAERRRLAEKPEAVSLVSRIAAAWNAVSAATLRLAALVGVGIVVFSIISSTLERSIIIGPLSVPKSMNEAGFTADVVTLRLKDLIGGLIKETNFSRNKPQEDLIPRSELQDIVLPGVGTSMQTLVEQISTFLAFNNRRKITGEFTTGDGQVGVSLRLDGEVFFTEKVAVAQMADLLKSGAKSSLENALPYFFCLLVYHRDDFDLAFNEADLIIDLNNKCETPFMRWIHQVSCNDVAGAHNVKGNVLRKRGRPDEAIDEYRKAIEIDPELAETLQNIGNVLTDRGRRDEAIAYYRKAIAEYWKMIKTDPDNADAHYSLGFLLQDFGQRDEAIAEYKAAIAAKRKMMRKDPKDADAHYFLGFLLRELGQRHEAIDEFRKAIEIDPKDADAHYGLGSLLQDAGQLDDAIDELRKVIDIDPKYANAHDALGLAMRDLGQRDEAIDEFQKALALYDPKPDKPEPISLL